MTIQSFKQICEGRESLRVLWEDLAKTAFAYQAERLSLASSRVGNPEAPKPSSYVDKREAFVSTKDALVLQCDKDGVELPEDLSAGATSRLYYV